ncbi:MAG: SH3 domain-containing protein [Anaerolineales bacterium]|nr:SH3 domain-containing protein [Anaerolineales bacterium]
MKKTTLICLIFLTLAACAPQQPAATNTPLAPVETAAPLPTLIPTSTLYVVTSTAATLPSPIPPTNTAAPASTSTPLPPVTGINNPYAVILVSANDVLNIRSGAGTGFSIVGALSPSATGVIRTGPEANAGGNRWVEIQNPSGGTGWVNAKFLTEQVGSSIFCSDTRVNDLLNDLRSAMLNSSGELLASLVSPEHGLDLRLWRWGTVANYTPKESAWVFGSDYEVSWGPAPGSGADTIGTFSEHVLPKLQEVFSANYSLHCNDTLDLATFSTQPWPSEYSSVNFYTAYKPGSEQYGGLDWRAWTVGVEYVQGKPMLFSLINYQWEP